MSFKLYLWVLIYLATFLVFAAFLGEIILKVIKKASPLTALPIVKQMPKIQNYVEELLAKNKSDAEVSKLS